jgi:hypothetical protein
MSTSAVSPVLGTDFGASTATSSQKSVFNDLINQLEQAIGGGDLSTTQTLFNAVEALSPSSSGGNDPLGSFLSSLSKALHDDSVGEAQSALAAYLSATASSSSSTPATESAATSAASIASGLVLSQIQLNLVSSLLGGGSGSSSAASSTSSSTLDGLLNLVNTAYSSAEGSSGGSSSGGSGSATAAASSTPFDTLVSAIQANLTSGSSAAETLLSYLSPTGNFINTTA